MPIDDIEALIQMTPKNLRNFYEMLVLSGSLEFAVKMYFDYDFARRRKTVHSTKDKNSDNGTF